MQKNYVRGESCLCIKHMAHYTKEAAQIHHNKMVWLNESIGISWRLPELYFFSQEFHPSTGVSVCSLQLA